MHGNCLRYSPPCKGSVSSDGITSGYGLDDDGSQARSRDLWPESIVAVGALRRGWGIRLCERIEAWAYRKADTIVPVTDSFRHHIEERGAEADKITVVKNGVDLERFSRPRKDQGLARELGLDGKFTAAYFGTHRMAHAGGLGADAVIITASTKSDEPVDTAAEIARFKARIVVVGFVGMGLKRDLYYKKELDLRLSMSYGPGRYDPRYEEQGQDCPIAYVRWTEQRNMQTFLELVKGRADGARGSDLASLHDPRVGAGVCPARQQGAVSRDRPDLSRGSSLGAAAADQNQGTPGESAEGAAWHRVHRRRQLPRSVLLPNAARSPGLRFTGVATATG
jgi:Glycosyltransferase Family 4